MTREGRLAEAFADLAQVLVSDFDLTALLHRLAATCSDVSGAAGVGIVVADGSGALRDVAYSSEAIRRLERFQLQVDEGPCVECYRRGTVVQVPDLSAAVARWPRFAPEAGRSGISAVCALPLRLHGRTVGAMNLFHGSRGLYAPAVLRGVQALADLAMIGIVQYGRGPGLVDSAQSHIKKALSDRSVIEQAKGFLAEHGNLSMDEAFEHLCAYAESTGRGLTSAARGLIDRTLDPDEILAPVIAGEPPEESVGT